MKCRKKNYRNKIHKHLSPRPEKKNKQEQPSYAYVTKKGNKEKEDTKQELNKLINELKNLIEILKMITKETIKEHSSTVPDKCDTQLKSGKKSKLNKNTNK